MADYEVQEIEGEVVIQRPLTGVWWKYGLGFALLQFSLWILLGYRNIPGYDVLNSIKVSYVVYGSFSFMIFLPFIFGRIGKTALMKFSLGGLILGLIVYWLYSFFGPARSMGLLPFFSFLQLAISGIFLGIVWELGKYVFNKIRD